MDSSGSLKHASNPTSLLDPFLFLCVFFFLVLVSLALVGLFLSFHCISLFDLCSCISYDCTLTALTDHLQVKGSVTNDLQGPFIQH